MDNGKVGYVLSDWKSTTYSGDGDASLRIIGRVLDVRANEMLDSSIFDLALPIGTRVIKLPEGGGPAQGRIFQTDEEGRLQPAEESDEQIDNGPQQLTSSRIKSMTLALTIGSIVVLSFAAAIKHRRRFSRGAS
jgi:hypothetical protein